MSQFIRTGSLSTPLQGKTHGSHQLRNHICFFAIAIVRIFKMTSYLNAYRNFINISTKDGQALLSNATDKFKSPLIGDNKISLWPGGKDYQKLKDNITRLSQWFRYQQLLQNVVTLCTDTPAIPPIVANPAAGILAAPEVPMSITYTNEIKILEV